MVQDRNRGVFGRNEREKCILPDETLRQIIDFNEQNANGNKIALVDKPAPEAPASVLDASLIDWRVDSMAKTASSAVTLGRPRAEVTSHTPPPAPGVAATPPVMMSSDLAYGSPVWLDASMVPMKDGLTVMSTLRTS